MVNLTPYGSRVLNSAQKLIAGMLASGSTPEEIEIMSQGAYTARQIKQLQHNSHFIKYLESCEDKYVDRLLQARVRTNKLLIGAAELAAQKIIDIAQTSSNQETARKAANDIIALAGLKTPDKVEHTVVPHLQVIFDEPGDSIDDDTIGDEYEQM